MKKNLYFELLLAGATIKSGARSCVNIIINTIKLSLRNKSYKV